MHIFHNWETTYKRKARFELTRLGRNDEEDAIASIQKCTKCGKERGIVKLLSGHEKEVDVDFIRR
jgi:hypothetical protein